MEKVWCRQVVMMLKKGWSESLKKLIKVSITLLFLGVIITSVYLNKDTKVYSEANCPETNIPCVNAFTSKNKVKLFNGTVTLEREDGIFLHGDVFKEDVERQQQVLVVEKTELVTLEFINMEPQKISVYQVGKENREIELDVAQHAFYAPSKSGTYNYELLGEYSNGTVHHYVKLKVK